MMSVNVAALPYLKRRGPYVGDFTVTVIDNVAPRYMCVLL